MLPLLAVLLIQGPGLDVTTSVDRARVGVGEEVLYTLRAVGHSTAAFRVDLPALDGFALIERRERTDVVTGTREATRAFTLELRLRAEQVGNWQIGPIRVEHGEASAFSPTESVMVTSAAGSGGTGLDADLMALIPRVPPPRTGPPSVFTVVSSDQVYAGDQVNVLTAAWLPRGLRLRLRQPPTLTPPALPGVWSTPRSAVPGAVASRVVDGEAYDLFVGFQTVYPLNPGAVPIPPARLSWMQPSGRQYFSEEQRQIADSPPLTLVVRPLPDGGRLPGFDGPVARDVTIEYQLGQGSARSGSVLPVSIEVSGAGNLPLWPTPRVTWPAGVRVYEEGTEENPRLTGIRLGGTKRFRFAVVPDSAGSLSLPPLEYAYFDPNQGGYRVARAPGIAVPVLDAAPVADRRAPPPLEEPGPPTLADRIMNLPGPVLGLLIGVPILAAAGAGTLRRRATRRAPPREEADSSARLDALLGALAPAGTRASAGALAAALRSAGVDREGAERLVQLHFAVEAERFGPRGAGSAPPELQHAIEAALRRVPARIRRVSGRVMLGVLGGLLMLAPAERLEGQSGIELYARGEYGAAAEAFRAEAASFPKVSSHWYDLAAAEFMARRDAQAVAALVAARALAPRDHRVVALWGSLAREHELIRRGGRSWPIDANECYVAALLLLWIGAALLVLVSRRRALAVAALLLAAGSVAAGLALRAQRTAPRAVLTGGASLRLSPHGLAPERGALPAFSIVILERHLDGWWLVRSGDGAEGWVPADVLARSPALD
jgi:hypothetical protein